MLSRLQARSNEIGIPERFQHLNQRQQPFGPRASGERSPDTHTEVTAESSHHRGTTARPRTVRAALTGMPATAETGMSAHEHRTPEP